MTVFLIACHAGSLETVSFLIGCGVMMSSKDLNGWTSIHHATLNDYPDIIRVLVQNYPLLIELKTADE